MRTNYHRFVTLTGNRGDDAELAPWMVKFLDFGAVFSCSRIRDSPIDLLVQPLRGLDAGGGFEEPRVERGKHREMFLHVFLG